MGNLPVVDGKDKSFVLRCAELRDLVVPHGRQIEHVAGLEDDLHGVGEVRIWRGVGLWHIRIPRRERHVVGTFIGFELQLPVGTIAMVGSRTEGSLGDAGLAEGREEEEAFTAT